MLETLIAIPIVLLLGFSVLQWALLFHARAALDHALIEAARAGSVAHARPVSIDAGLARGLAPYWAQPGPQPSPDAAFNRARARLAAGRAAGWIFWQQLSPTADSFADWGEPARDAAGMPIPDLIEIPNDNLRWHGQRLPKQAVRQPRHDDVVGAQSLQTLSDVNLLKLELRYGVPMTVPLIGRFAVWVMRSVDGCEPAQRWRLGLIDFDAPVPQAQPRQWACDMYLAPDETGRPVPRWPIRAAVTLRMQTPARPSERMVPHTQTPASGGSLGTGHVDPPDGFQAIGYRPRGVDPPADGGSLPQPPVSGGDAAGPARLQIGADRSFSTAGACY